jgi:hypothetical protein
VGLNLILTFALLRRVRPVQSVVEAGGGLPNPALPQVGHTIGAFQALTVPPAGDASLSEQSLSEGSTLVGFFLTQCPQCQDVYRELLRSRPPESVIAFVAGRDENPRAAEKLAGTLLGLGRVAFVDEAINAAFGITPQTGFPTLLRVKKGAVIASGHAVDDLYPSPTGQSWR